MGSEKSSRKEAQCRSDTPKISSAVITASLLLSSPFEIQACSSSFATWNISRGGRSGEIGNTDDTTTSSNRCHKKHGVSFQYWSPRRRRKSRSVASSISTRDAALLSSAGGEAAFMDGGEDGGQILAQTGNNLEKKSAQKKAEQCMGIGYDQGTGVNLDNRSDDDSATSPLNGDTPDLTRTDSFAHGQEDNTMDRMSHGSTKDERDGREEQQKQQHKSKNNTSSGSWFNQFKQYCWALCAAVLSTCEPSTRFVRISVNSYLYMLNKRPLLTKAITSGFVGACGDLLAQTFEHQLSVQNKNAENRNDAEEETKSHQANGKNETATNGNAASPRAVAVRQSKHQRDRPKQNMPPIIRYDMRRAIAIASDGVFGSGPLMHYAYDAFEAIFPVHDVSASPTVFTNLLGTIVGTQSATTVIKWMAAVSHVVLDIIFMDIFYVLSLMVISAIVEGRIRQVPHELRNEYMSTLKASWASSVLLAPMHVLSFRYLPLQLRVLSMNMHDVIWNAVVSYMAHRSRK